MSRPEPRPYEIAPDTPDASFFEPDPHTTGAVSRRRWLPDPATAAVIVSAAFVFALLAVIFANRFVF